MAPLERATTTSWLALAASFSAAIATAACDGPTIYYDAVADADTSDANVVVKVGQCTGTLLTPGIVLTASHCIRGSVNPAGPGAATCSGDTRPYVSIGPRWLAPSVVVESWGSATKVEACQTAARRGEDMAVVYLRQAIAPSLRRGTWPVPRVVRPSLSVPPRDNDHFDTVVRFAGYSPWDDDYSTWRFLTRRVQPLINIRVAHETRLGGANFVFDLPDGAGVRAGDSGGPMFASRADGSRDVLGIITQTRGDTCFAVDVTWPDNKDWLLAHVTEGGVAELIARGKLDRDIAHTDGWLARHGKSRDDWWGELDYSGPCDEERDRDCDGWWDHGDAQHPNHDDCPEHADPDQRDSEDHGVGDACRYAEPS